MRYLNKIIFLNSAHIPYAEIRLDGNVHFIGTQGVGKSTLLRAILFFYNADKLKLGIPKEKKSFDAFYFPYANSYIAYEVMRENGAYTILAIKMMGRVAFRFIDAPYQRHWLMDERNEVYSDWGRIRSQLAADHLSGSTPVTVYETYRDIIFGNNRRQELVPFRKFALTESAKYQNIPRTIQNVFLNSKLDADFIKETIIRSLSDEDAFIDLTYFRAQIETFEQEYRDISCWFTPGKNGEIVVRRQADQVMNGYRHLIYIRKQIEEGREELNAAEQTARQRLPYLDDQRQQAVAQCNRLARLAGEEEDKYRAERDRIVKQQGAIDAELKRIREKQQHYRQVDIDTIVRRVAQEDSWLQEQEQLKRLISTLTAAYNDVVSKYRNLTDALEADWKAFENHQQSLYLQRQEEMNARRDIFLAERQEGEAQTYRLFDERIQCMHDTLLQLQAEQNMYRQKVVKAEYQHPYQKEIEACRADLATLEQKDRELELQIRNSRMECQQMRAAFEQEEKDLTWKLDRQIEALQQKQQTVDEQMASVNKLMEHHRGSFCEWLEQHKPGWQDTIGKVADEAQILYNNQLHPQVDREGSQTLFGIRLDLSAVRRELRTPEMLKQEFQALQQQAGVLSQQGVSLRKQHGEALDALKKKYTRRLREASDRQHTLEAERRQLPALTKNAKADLATWTRKESEWRTQEKEKIEQSLNEVSSRMRRAEEERQQLDADKGKQLQAVRNQYKSRQKELQQNLAQLKEALAAETEQKKEECARKKAELQRMQKAELEGKEADTTTLERYNQRLQEIEQELAYIRRNRSLASDYAKDKRELFDREPELRNQRKTMEACSQDLQDKYLLRRQKLTAQQKEAKEALTALEKEQNTLRDDVGQAVAFRKDETFCPPEACTDKVRPTRKSCRDLIDMLKSLIVSTISDTKNFQRAVNQFKGNFTSKNTFQFPMELASEQDYYDFAANLCEFVDNDKLSEYRKRISERYTDIIRRISKETGDLTQNESEINKTIRAINDDFIERNFAGVIRQIVLRSQPTNDKLMQLLIEIRQFNEDNQFNMGEIDLFSQASRTDVNEKAVDYLLRFMRCLIDEPARKQLLLSDTFKLEFRVVENDNDTGWVEKIANVGSDGTDILVKAMVNIMLINVFKEKVSRRFGDFKLHCMMDEIGKLHPNNVKGILDFANRRNILLINSSPTTYNAEDYRYTYLLKKDKDARTQVIPLLTHKPE